MSKSNNLYKEYFQALAIAIIAALILRTFVLQAFRIPTGSMKDTLLVGDFLLVNKFVYGIRTPDRIGTTNIEIPHVRLPAFKNPKRGDIVVFQFPRDRSVDYIKRCVGVPGDTIKILHNRVYVNGVSEGKEQLVDKQYDSEEESTYVYYKVELEDGAEYTIRKRVNGRNNEETYGPVVVPPEHYFMMGDNRDNSSDSRFWGYVPRENILGKALVIYFSFDKRRQPAWNVVAAVRWNRILDIIR
jgi:signal peptidase I